MPMPTHATHASPEELDRHGLRLLLDKDIPARPGRLGGGKAVAASIRHHPDLRIHQTAGPQTIVVGMRGAGRLAGMQGPFGVTGVR
ncbi:hypothetical protein [Streptomyces sp. PR69]|uniref:hypothetical protein n=1 Tax=Streptomyces sp. PR69 TaxID=2984950 RepID=UPI003A5C749F